MYLGLILYFEERGQGTSAYSALPATNLNLFNCCQLDWIACLDTERNNTNRCFLCWLRLFLLSLTYFQRNLAWPALWSKLSSRSPLYNQKLFPEMWPYTESLCFSKSPHKHCYCQCRIYIELEWDRYTCLLLILIMAKYAL